MFLRLLVPYTTAQSQSCLVTGGALSSKVRSCSTAPAGLCVYIVTLLQIKLTAALLLQASVLFTSGMLHALATHVAFS
jgi:hypothetical protein